MFTGVILSAIFFSAEIAKVHVKHTSIPKEKKKLYEVSGQLFFVSVTDFVSAFEYEEQLECVEINFSHAQLWDDSAVAALDKVMLKFKLNHIQVQLSGLNAASSQLIEKMSSAKLNSH